MREPFLLEVGVVLVVAGVGFPLVDYSALRSPGSWKQS